MISNSSYTVKMPAGPDLANRLRSVVGGLSGADKFIGNVLVISGMHVPGRIIGAVITCALEQWAPSAPRELRQRLAVRLIREAFDDKDANVMVWRDALHQVFRPAVGGDQVFMRALA